MRKIINGAIPFLASGFVLMLVFRFGIEVLAYVYALTVLAVGSVEERKVKNGYNDRRDQGSSRILKKINERGQSA